MTERLGRDPGEQYRALAEELGDPAYERIDAAVTSEEKEALAQANESELGMKELGGDPVTSVLTIAPGNGQPIGGIKVVTKNAWFAARPSGTEAVYKLYAESFKGEGHLRRVQEEAQAGLQKLFRAHRSR